MIGQGFGGGLLIVSKWFNKDKWIFRLIIVCFCILLLSVTILMLQYEAEGPFALIIKLIG
jgi:hypothetical protein